MKRLVLIACFFFCSNIFAVEIYGHRGARGLSPENTMPAYKTALRLGVNYVDMDIGITKDGIVVITHNVSLNPDITRNNKGQWIKSKTLFIKDLTLKEAQSYDVGKIKPGTKYAKLFPAQYPVPNTHIPTLKSVIDYVKRVAGNKVGFQIEIKTDPTHPKWTFSDERFAKQLAKIMEDEGIVNRTEVQAFDFQALIDLQKINPNIKTAYLTDAIGEEEARSDSKSALLWSAGHSLRNYGNSIPKMIKALGGKLWGPQDTELTKKSLDEAHRLGLKVVVWTWPKQTKKEIDPKMIEKLIDWGVDGIITDRPDILRGLMAARGLPLPRPYTNLP